jgi:molybdate transport system substrate-binding protein
VFISADKKWMDELRRSQRIDVRTERQLAGNRLVVIQPTSRPTMDPQTWIQSLGRGRLATGDPDFVPLGRYAREALVALGMWKKLEPRIARAENARVATLLVARGEALLGIVYATDAIAESRVDVVTSLDRSLHSPIVYPAALTREASPSAMAYLNFLVSDEGQKFFARRGFELGTQHTIKMGQRFLAPSPPMTRIK